MKKIVTILITLIFIFTPCINAKGLVSEKDEKNIKNLYNEQENEVVAVFNESKPLFITNKDVYLMAQVVYGESCGEPYRGKIAVASVILNRLISSKFPNTVEGVVKQKKAFSCVKNGSINIEPDKNSYNAVLDALKGKDPTSKALFFYNPKISTCNWMKNISKKNIITIGNHVFFAVK
ncbi:cell wall hydrolase [Haloimpatiens sp. FM7330]|uniref:cell wall hydrolase n=1 Tax=Haloimpatiens sp. FM7330 TaxID=3298610 RepID=UPI00362FC8D3